jgi:hypothetical protein
MFFPAIFGNVAYLTPLTNPRSSADAIGKVRPMKVQIEIDCTPEEARRFMGLPDVDKANAVYVDAFAKAMQGASNVDQLQEYAKQLAPMGQMGLKMFQQFMEGSRRTSSDSSATDEKDTGRPKA